MKNVAALALAALFCLPAVAQEKIGNAHDAKFKYEKAIKRIAGVKDVTVGGINNDLKIIVRVESEEAKKEVTLLVGTRLDGHPVVILLAGASEGPSTAPAAPVNTATCEACVCPCHKRVGQTVAEPAKPVKPVEAEVDQCDVLLEATGKPARKSKANDRCTQMVGWTNDPEKMKWVGKNGFPSWPSREMPGFTCYTYIKHRATCPIGSRSLIDDIKRLTPGK